MDRRTRKTREAIFNAFTQLLAKKHLESITVGQIIALADVGRATFYAHFETKDQLLQSLCQELFCHVFDSLEPEGESHRHIFDCDAPDSMFLHLFLHLQKNDNGILQLLSCHSNTLFLQYFKEGLIRLLKRRQGRLRHPALQALPEDYWADHVAAAFLEAVTWWHKNGMAQTPEEMTRYFLLAAQIQEN